MVAEPGARLDEAAIAQFLERSIVFKGIDRDRLLEVPLSLEYLFNLDSSTHSAAYA